MGSLTSCHSSNGDRLFAMLVMDPENKKEVKFKMDSY